MSNPDWTFRIPPGTVIDGVTIHDRILSTYNSCIYDASLSPTPLEPTDENKLVFKHLNPTTFLDFTDTEIPGFPHLSSCPHSITGFGETVYEGARGYFMKRCRFGDLDSFMMRESLSEASIAGMSFRVLEALAFMHKMGFAHRDVKPANILLHGNPQNPETFLADFDYAAKPIKGTEFHRMCGTPLYQAPELIGQVPYDVSVDIWAFGVTLFLMRLKENPFGDQETDPDTILWRIYCGEWNENRLQEVGVSPELSDLIRKCLVKDPTDRITANDALSHPFYRKAPLLRATSETMTSVDHYTNVDDIHYGAT